MFLNILENYLKKLSINDIILFANKNNIPLTITEVDYIYKTIKKDYKILLSDDYEKVFIEARAYIENDKLKKIYNLFLDYRHKYKNFLN